MVKTYLQRTFKGVIDESASRPRGRINRIVINNRVWKNALNDNERLGPHWRTHVAKAIQRLVDEGIVDALQGTRGYFQLSSISKKQISEFKRAASDPQQAAVNHILRGSGIVLSPGTKRHADSEENTSRRKKPRTGSGPFDKLSKKDLLARVKNLQLQCDNLQKTVDATHPPPREPSPPLSPLTDLDDEEFPFGNRDMEVDTEEQRSDESDMPGLDGFGTPHTPPSTPLQRATAISFAPIPAARASRSLAHRTHSLPGLTRTQSGSYISEVSKQPTPDPDVDGVAADYADHSPHGAPIVEDTMSDNERAIHSPARNYLATPGPTPPRASATVNYEVPTTYAAGESSSRQRIDSLSSQLERVEVERRRIGDSNSAHVSTITALNGEIQDLRSKIVNLESREAKLERESLNLRTSLEQSAGLVAQLKGQLSEAAIALQSAADNLQNKTNELNQLQTQLEEAQRAVRECQTALEETDASHTEEIVKLTSSLASAEAKVEELSLEIRSSRTACAELQSLVDGVTAEKDLAGSELEAERQRRSAVQGELDEALLHVDDLQSQLNVMEELSAGDEITINKLNDVIRSHEQILMSQMSRLKDEADQVSQAATRRRSDRLSL
ncbi:hypothetical protein GYMLUDRAFT_36623 [Collybiopsis luxurians FD-317 M1]|nr:hypothetical protein GYMLUDRAFT_36623 [Collybiopsis luxurians FD-317 M1]